jgi:peptide/nickel transport system permease protein
MARVDGSLRFPAFSEFLGAEPASPEGSTWKEWWATLGDDTEDWAIRTPWPYGPYEDNLERVLHKPDLSHPMGNDDTGRDVLARLIHGTSLAMGIGLASVLLAMMIGVPLGGWAGYSRGLVDDLISRVVEVFLCFPALFLVLAAAAFFGSSTIAVILVLGLVYWTSFARIVRGEFLSLREREFVLAAKGLGVSDLRIWTRHMLPCVRGPILVTAAFGVAAAVVVESTLSFLGLGPGLQSASWGGILAQGKQWAHLGAWHLWFFPALMVVATVACFHGLADRFQGARQG